MAKPQLSASQKSASREELESYWGTLQSQAALMTEQYRLSIALTIMKELGMRTWHDRSYQDWKQLHDYVTRITFNRCLTVKLSDRQIGTAVGSDSGANVIFGGPPLQPNNPILQFSLESSDYRRQLVCLLRLSVGRSGMGHLNRHELSVLFFRRYNGELSIAQLAMHFVDLRQPQANPRHRCQVYCCASHRIVDRAAEVEQAYEASGVVGVWHALDRIWSDGYAWRPLHRPLSPPALAVRCLVHQDRIVKVLTHGQPIVGRLIGDYRDMQQHRDHIRLQPVEDPDNTTVVQTGLIPTDDVFEILPWRLDD